MHIRIYMVKVISLSEEAYSKLKAAKHGRSFSEAVVELLEGRKTKSIMEFAGIWANDNDYWEQYEKEIRKSRNQAKLREVRL